MKCRILHETVGRLRIHAEQRRMTLHQADILEYYLRNVDGVTDVKVYDRTCDAVIFFVSGRQDIVHALSRFSYTDETALALVPDRTGRELNREYQDKLVNCVLRRCFSRLFIPAPIRAAISVVRSL